MRGFGVLGTLLLALILVTGNVFASTHYLDDTDTSENGLFKISGSMSGTLEFEWKTNAVEVNYNEDNSVAYSINAERMLSSESEVPVAGGLVRLPWGYNGSLSVKSGLLTKFDAENGFTDQMAIGDASFDISAVVELGSSAIFRDITVAPLTIKPVVNDDLGNTWIASVLEFEVQATEQINGFTKSQPQRPVSRAFYPMYQGSLLNDLDEIGVRLAETKGSYVIFASNAFAGALHNFVEWKRQKGYNVVLNTYDEAPGFNEMRNQIVNYYNTLEPQLEYVLLVGDENRGGTSAIQSERIQNPGFPSENDVTDWPYVFIEGDDYFPEVFIGRMTVETSNEAYNASSRVVDYEKNSESLSQDDPYWSGAALVAANWSEGGATPLTPVATTEWLYERMREGWGIHDATLLPWHQGGEQATDVDVTNTINQGALFVTYRGWGNARGWDKPDFDYLDVEGLNNYGKLPVVTSFVCNTGDFGNATYSTCFGESWIVAGSANRPRGAVTVIAPSDLHTRTKYNNALLTGFYTGLFDENLSSISQALLRAKHELFMGFPNERSSGSFVEFYYHVYHVIGDPELTVWKGSPYDLTVTMDENIPLGQDYLEVHVETTHNVLRDGYVQVIQGENVFAGRYTDADGNAYIPLDGLAEGDLQVTITKQRCQPYIDTVQVAQQGDFLSVDGWSAGVGPVSVGVNTDLTVTVKNDGTNSATGVTGTLSTANTELVTISTADATFGDIAAGGTEDGAFVFTLNDYVEDGQVLEFDLLIEDNGSNSYSTKIWIPVSAMNLQYVGYEVEDGEVFEPGATANITFDLLNIGSLQEEGMTATLISWDEVMSVTSPTSTLNFLDAQGNAQAGPFEVTISSETYGGRVINMALVLSLDGTTHDALHFALQLDGASQDDPHGPDAYGYYAYDNIDTDWDEAPEYTWHDLHNQEGAEIRGLTDDDNICLSLPFDFQFYGEVYEEGSTITVNSNGWMALGWEEDYTVNFFRNWHIPSTLGPHTLIAPFWDDLKPHPNNERIHIYHYYDEAAGALIIEWYDSVNRFGYNISNYPERFSIVLYDQDAMPTETGDGVIEFHYHDVVNIDEDNNYASVGIQNEGHSVGLECSYGSLYPASVAPLEGGRAIRFTTEAPDAFFTGNNGEDELIANSFSLMPSYPNPFNSSTKIRFNLVTAGMVKVGIYNILGQEVASLVNREMKAGMGEVVWDLAGSDISSGLFFVKLEAADGTLWQKVMFVK